MINYLCKWIIEFQSYSEARTRFYGVSFFAGLFAPSILFQISKGVHITLDIRYLFCFSGGINLAIYNPWEVFSVAS